MQFKRELAEKILEGRMTVTRRPVTYEIENRSILRRLPCRYKVGHTYAVQPTIESGPGKGRGGKAIGRIRILDVRRGLLAGVDAAEANLEGFPNVAAFLRYWRGLYGHVNPSQLVDRIEFELITDQEKERSDG